MSLKTPVKPRIQKHYLRYQMPNIKWTIISARRGVVSRTAREDPRPWFGPVIVPHIALSIVQFVDLPYLNRPLSCMVLT